VLCFADLKKYNFIYLVGFPALHSDGAWNVIEKANSAAETEGDYPDRFRDHLNADEATALVDSVQTWRYSVDARQYGFFLVKKIRASRPALGQDGQSKEVSQDDEGLRPTTPGTSNPSIGFTWVIGSLARYEQGFFDNIHPQDCFIGFADPSTYPSSPGWMLRNLLVLMRKRWGLNKAQILCYRDVQSRRHEAKSIILTIEVDRGTPSSAASNMLRIDAEIPKITGWERNHSGKMGKTAKLGEHMDPQR
jgi:ubiquitin-like modifier-activating enzyme ATG7